MTRTRQTWFGYFLLGIFGVGVALPGPLVPFVAEKLGLTFTQQGAHFAALAAGNLLVGLFGDWIVNRYGRSPSAWAGIALIVAGAVGMVYGPVLSLTLLGAHLAGLGSGLASLVGTASLTDGHPIPADRTRALSESNIAAALAVASTPLTVGVLARVLAWTWTPVYVGVLALASAALFGGVRLPHQVQDAHSGSDKALPPLYWMFGAVLFLTIAIEWVTLSWTPNFLATEVGFDEGTAAVLGSSFAWMTLFGRVLGRWIIAFVRPRRLFLGAYALMTLIFPVYLFSDVPAVSVAALAALGLLAANQFPLALDAAMSAGAANSSRASARVSVFGGLATLILPQTVGRLADSVGLRSAFSLVILLAALAVVLGVVAFRFKDRPAAVSP